MVNEIWINSRDFLKELCFASVLRWIIFEEHLPGLNSSGDADMQQWTLKQQSGEVELY